MSSEELAESVRVKVLQAVQIAEAHADEIHVPTDGQKGAMIGVMNRVCGDDENRRLLLGWLFAPSKDFFSLISTKSLSDAQWAALYGWCNFQKDEDRNVWLPQERFVPECMACLTEAMRAYHRIKLQYKEFLPAPPEIVSVATTLGGEIKDTGVKGAGIRIGDEHMQHNKPLASPPPERKGLHEPLKGKKPKLINPF